MALRQSQGAFRATALSALIAQAPAQVGAPFNISDDPAMPGSGGNIWTSAAPGYSTGTNAAVATTNGVLAQPATPFNIPAGATITGVQVSYIGGMNSKLGAAALSGTGLQLFTSLGRSVNKLPVDDWTLAKPQWTYGGPTDLWGLALTPAVVNAASFGFEVLATQINNGNTAPYFQPLGITVYYGLPTGTAAGVQVITNLYDVMTLPATPNQSQRSPGATLLDGVLLTPSLSQKWKLLSVNVTAYLALLYPAAPGNLYGKLGKLIAALVLSGAAPTQQPASAFQTPMLASPPDPSLAVTLWDGDNDRVPPPFATNPQPTNPTQGLAVSGGVTLPVPVDIREGQQLAIGLWLTSSLLGSIGVSPLAGLIVMGASYNVNYDDGL